MSKRGEDVHRNNYKHIMVSAELFGYMIPDPVWYCIFQVFDPGETKMYGFHCDLLFFFNVLNHFFGLQ